jgi:hypothetical protein
MGTSWCVEHFGLDSKVTRQTNSGENLAREPSLEKGWELVHENNICKGWGRPGEFTA